MRMLLSTLYLSILCIAALSCDNASDDMMITNEGDEEIEVVLEALTMLNVSYGENDDQVYDLYLPEGRTTASTKTIVIIHGGGWTEGDKADVNGFVSLIQTTHPDHAIVNMNYEVQ